MKIKQNGFTLIELLIVIIIIGILAGVVITVINPAQQQKRANEGVVKANVDKIALAMKACVVSSSAPTTQCDTFAEIGVVSPNGTPTGATYSVAYAASVYTASGVVGGCTYSDALNGSTYVTTRSTSGTCAGSW